MLFDKRGTYDRYFMIHMFMLDAETVDSSYIAYLLYDLLSTSSPFTAGAYGGTSATLDTNEQRQVFDCFVYSLKMSFKNVMHSTVEYTRRIMELDHESIPYEQQICLMKCSDYVKQKAMVKFKEVRGRTDDSSCKAKQYLDGLLKIPFGQYYMEDIMQYRHENIDLYQTLIASYMNILPTSNTDQAQSGNALLLDAGSPKTSERTNERNAETEGPIRITNADITSNLEMIRTNYREKLKAYVSNRLRPAVLGLDRETLTTIVTHVNGMLKMATRGPSNAGVPKRKRILHSGKTKEYLVKELVTFVEWCVDNNASLLHDVMHFLNIHMTVNYSTICEIIARISSNTSHIGRYMREVNTILNDAVYGHEEAKNNMQRVIAQWINGEPSGRCLGFEGPPGCGKTSFAKNGVARCLRNVDGSTRPFAFIALGGSSNASFLEGHSYTYVGSTWGKIVDILIEKKCMNPIIFIDELDKISRTEYGKEINGILTHLVDSTQNSEFYDKYFAGIPLDLSRVLFIFSYNDVSQIDKVVLDRIHRLRFDALSLDDKLVVVRRHMLPQLLREVGLEKHVTMNDEVISYIIQNNTRESGVRKLKELLYEVVSEINLAFLKAPDSYRTAHGHGRRGAIGTSSTSRCTIRSVRARCHWRAYQRDVGQRAKEGGILPSRCVCFRPTRSSSSS